MNHQQRHQAQLNCIYNAFGMGFQQVSQTNLPQIFRNLIHQGRAHLRDSITMGLDLVNRFGDICVHQNVLNLWHFLYIIILDGSDEGSRISTERIKNSLLQIHHKFPQNYFKIIFIGIDLQNDYIAKKELAELAIIPQIDIINIRQDQMAQALNEINTSSIIIYESDQQLQVQKDIGQNIILMNIEITNSMSTKWPNIREALIEFIKKLNSQSLICALGFNESCQILAIQEIQIQQQQQELPLPLLQNEQVQQSQHLRKILTVVIAIIILLVVFFLIIFTFFRKQLLDYLAKI